MNAHKDEWDFRFILHHGNSYLCLEIPGLNLKKNLAPPLSGGAQGNNRIDEVQAAVN